MQVRLRKTGCGPRASLFRKVVLVAALAPAAITGCSRPGPDAPPASVPPAPTSGVPAPPPVITSGLRETAITSAEVTLKTDDGWFIVGDRYDSFGPSKGAVILLHQRDGSAKDWLDLCKALQRAGYTALALDQRGAGRSISGQGGVGPNAPWPTSGDVEAGIASVKDKGPVGLIGASYGANNALIYAAAHPALVKGVVLFSPGANYHGLDATTPAAAYTGPVLVFYGKQDTIPDDGPRRIKEASKSPDCTLVEIEGGEHGAALLKPDTIRQTLTFIERTLK